MLLARPPAAAGIAIEEPEVGDDWAAWRVEDAARRANLLRSLCADEVPLVIGGAGGTNVSAVLESVDTVHEQLILASRAEAGAFTRAIAPLRLWAAAAVGTVRLQFALQGAMGFPEGSRWVVHAAVPKEMYRLPRRLHARVPRAPQQAAIARFHGADEDDISRDFAVLDISEAGCAVLLPAGTAPPEAGSRIVRVELELDDLHLLFTDARVQHVTTGRRGTHRVGCRWENMPPSGAETLARWLARAPRRDAPDADSPPPAA